MTESTMTESGSMSTESRSFGSHSGGYRGIRGSGLGLEMLSQKLRQERARGEGCWREKLEM